MKDIIYQLAVGGYLHDIGKIGQRAKIEPSNETRRLEQDLCPKNKYGRPTHKHVLLTSQFIDQIRTMFLDIILGDTKSHWDNIYDIASNHHIEAENDYQCKMTDKMRKMSGSEKKRETSG